ncbi:MAG: hypothetical protein AB2L20_28145 [Mangrovibacterium sp.]
MKIAFAATLLLMIVSLSGFTQSKPKMTEEQKKEIIVRFEEYKEKLNLTEEQQPEVQKINSEYFEALAGLRESNASRMNKFRTFRDLKSARDSKMKKVLTKEQYKIYTNFQAEIREEFMRARQN